MPIKSGVVKDYMARTLVTFKPETDVLDAVHTLVQHRIAGAPVVDDDPVRDYMSDGVETVDADMSIVDLAQVFINKKFRRFPVVQGTRLVGQISRRDVLRALENIAKG
jgi:CBS domain-containing protein